LRVLAGKRNPRAVRKSPNVEAGENSETLKDMAAIILKDDTLKSLKGKVVVISG
jgi:hypothetical protein